MRRGALGGDVPVALVRNQNHPTSIAVDDANIYWVSDSGSATLAVGCFAVATARSVAIKHNLTYPAEKLIRGSMARRRFLAQLLALPDGTLTGI